MRRSQRIVLFVATGLLIATWLYPPWIWTQHAGHITVQAVEYRFLFSAPGSFALDWPRLICSDAIILAIVGAMMIARRRRIRFPRIGINGRN